MPPTFVAPPPTDADPITETVHGVEITDSYRWLEDQNSMQTRAWLEDQAAYTQAYLAKIPGREHVRARVEELLALKEATSEPRNVGERYFFLKHLGDREQPVIAMKEGLSAPETILVDPRARATGTSTAVAIAAISEDGRFLAYFVRQGGTDHSVVEILDVERNVVLPDRLPEGFCTGIAFAQDGSGFYYSHRKLDDERPNHRAVFWHCFGADLSEDREMFRASEEPNLFLGIIHSVEAKLLAYVVFSTGKVRYTSIYLQEMTPGADKAKLLLEGIEGSFVPFFAGGQLLAYTDFAAPNFRIVLIDVADPDPLHWGEIVPESNQRIQRFGIAGHQIFITRTNRFSTTIETFGLDGTRKDDIPVPPYATVDLLNPIAATKLFYSYTSISKPPTVYSYDPRKQELSVWEEAKGYFDPSVVASEDLVYPSRDGTSVPLFLAARRDILHSGPLPTFLTGYGGFGNCVTPRFTAFATFLMEQGFLFAVPALRGGSELGEQWHRAGKRENRQNSFDDFIAAAEWLIAQGRSAPGRVAIGGGSNAGLLVGAAITQRPDLFRAAICLGPLLDMTRYHLFDFAAGWADEYGSPEDEHDFHSLLSYSPYHHVLDGAFYPAILLISGDSDTRCNPMHARKMAARLQAANASGHPVLLDYRTAWGHTPVQPLSTRIEALTDRLAFVCHELGAHSQPARF